jgi:3-oxoacyl-[acyl-carrier protein] reductase
MTNHANLQYRGKVVVVTGDRRGVGAEITSYLLSSGAKVAGISRNSDRMIETHPDYLPLAADLSDPHQIVRAFKEVHKRWQRLDILVNNAAVLTSIHALFMTPSAAQAMLQTNLLGAFYCSTEAAKLMKRNKYGRIVNMTSIAVPLEVIGDSMYAATKAGVDTLSGVFSKEWSGFGVTCNNIGITAIETDMLRQHPRDRIDEVIAKLPIPRYATFDDIANVFDFFTSDKSGYITGQTVYLGGVRN